MATPIEQEIRAAAAGGMVFDGRSPSGDRRSVRADLIYELCVDDADVHARGVRLSRVDVNDMLSFEGASLRVPAPTDPFPDQTRRSFLNRRRDPPSRSSTH